MRAKPSLRGAILGLALLFAGTGCKHFDLVHRHYDAFRYGAHGNSITPMAGVIADPGLPIQDLYGLQVGDLLEIKFPYRADLSETVTIREDGMISLPLIEPVFAAGKTPGQLQVELAAAYQAMAYDPTATNPPDSKKEYLLQVNDVIEIKFDDYPQFSDSVTIRPDGKVSLALVKTVQAEGRTPEKLEEELTKLYSAKLKNANLVVIVRQATGEDFFVNGVAHKPGLRNLEGLTVMVRSLAPRQVFVTGEVEKPGFYAYNNPMTALQAIIAAGGHRRSGLLRQVVLLRKVNNREPVAMCLNLKVDYAGVGTNDVPLRPYDVIIVPKTPITKVINFMQQYVYDLAPIARNATFNMIYQIDRAGINFNPAQNVGP